MDQPPQDLTPDDQPVADKKLVVGARKRTRPKKALPTERIAFGKQLDILRAHAVLSHEGERPAGNVAVGEMVKMSHTTVSLANPFFADIGLLQKSNGSHLPSREVIEFSRATQWGDEQAGQKLAPIIRTSWFGKAVLRSLAFSPSMDEAAALRQLAQEASAGPEYRSQMAMLLNYMEVSGLIERDGSHLKKLDPRPSQPDAPDEPTPTPKLPDRTETTEAAETAEERPEAQGGVQFQVNVHVDMAELSTWEPARITAFFNGLAQVIAAKGALDEGGPEA